MELSSGINLSQFRAWLFRHRSEPSQDSEWPPSTRHAIYSPGKDNVTFNVDLCSFSGRVMIENIAPCY